MKYLQLVLTVRCRPCSFKFTMHSIIPATIKILKIGHCAIVIVLKRKPYYESERDQKYRFRHSLGTKFRFLS